MEFGMFHEFPALPGRTESEAFDEAMEQVDAAERLGFDVMWLAELHFEPRRSVLSAPLSIASAIAARTRRMKIGIAVQVLPLCHPLRLAEEAATVDQLSHGRLIFGVGRSGVAQTYEHYGVSYAESRDRFREILDIIEQAWTKPSFSYEGQYHRFKDVAVVPKPYQKPLPPIRIAASTPDTFPAIGRRGAAIFASVRHTTWSHLAKQIRSYHKAWEEAGHRGRGQVFSRRRPMSPRPRSVHAPSPKKASCISITSRRTCWRGRRNWSTRKPPPAACGGSTSCAASVTRMACTITHWSGPPRRSRKSLWH
jgi:alkanesulfonate monooxygenase SsuD/methylene tetrahydromethanopterin reductase-like flavin-dependent oxidoreductase (luciferase family)